MFSIEENLIRMRWIYFDIAVGSGARIAANPSDSDQPDRRSGRLLIPNLLSVSYRGNLHLTQLICRESIGVDQSVGALATVK